VGVSLFFLLSGLVVPRGLASLSRSGVVVGRAMRILPTYAVGYLIVSAVATLNHTVTPVGASYSWSQILVGTVPGLGQRTG
jgi:peptidoglycan/LPS O-acetylase OafA/YrhL